jgi:hypothetical protein
MVPFKIVKGHRPRPATADCLVAFVIPHLDKGFQSAFLESNAIQESYPAFATPTITSAATSAATPNSSVNANKGTAATRIVQFVCEQ